MIRAEHFWELVERRAEATPEGFFALDESGRSMSFAGYRDAAERLAAFLCERGVREGTAVSWILPTGFPALTMLAALSRLGAVQNPIVPIYRRREVGHCLRQTQAELLIVPRVFRGFDYAAMAEELAREAGGLRVQVVEDGPAPWDEAGRASPPEPISLAPAIDEDPVRWIFYTSGSTSDPKGARHSDATVLEASYGLAEAMDLRPEDRIALVFPITHLGGANSLAAALASGCGHLLVERFDPPATIDFLAAHGVTHAGAGPAFHRAYLEAQRERPSESIFPRIRLFQGGGAAKDPRLHFALRDEIGGLGVLSVYGLTECPILSLGRVGDPDEKLAYTEGRWNLPGTEVRFVRGDGSEARPGEEGELRVRAPQLFKGYVDAALDREAFDEQGFFRTGDLGRIDAEGHLAISGRLKDVIIRKGENISPLEVENLLAQHPRVREVAVVGLPDEESGERACAVVACRSPGPPLELGEMVDFLREAGLMIQKIPEQLEIVDALPLGPSGKVAKRDLRERLLAVGSRAKA